MSKDLTTKLKKALEAAKIVERTKSKETITKLNLSRTKEKPSLTETYGYTNTISSYSNPKDFVNSVYNISTKNKLKNKSISSQLSAFSINNYLKNIKNISINSDIQEKLKFRSINKLSIPKVFIFIFKPVRSETQHPRSLRAAQNTY